MIPRIMRGLMVIALSWILGGCAEFFTIAVPVAVVSFTRAASDARATPTTTQQSEVDENDNED